MHVVKPTTALYCERSVTACCDGITSKAKAPKIGPRSATAAADRHNDTLAWPLAAAKRLLKKLVVFLQRRRHLPRHRPTTRAKHSAAGESSLSWTLLSFLLSSVLSLSSTALVGPARARASVQVDDLSRASRLTALSFRSKFLHVSKQ